MDYETAAESIVTESAAIREISAHGIDASADGGRLIEDCTGETIATETIDGGYRGIEILNWLGY